MIWPMIGLSTILPIFIVTLSLATPPARADAVSDEISEATKTATEICQSIPINQVAQAGSISAKGDAALNGFLRRMISVDGDVSGQAQESSSYGVLQQDLATAIEKGDDCRLAALQSLLKFLNTQPQTPTTQSIDPDGIYQFGQEVGKVDEASAIEDGKITFGRIMTNLTFDPEQEFYYRDMKLKIARFDIEVRSSGMGVADPVQTFARVTCSLLN